MHERQGSLKNPFNMDEDCQNCPALCETRNTVLHGYGDVGAEFLFISRHPDRGADQSGIPFGGERSGRTLLYILHELGLTRSSPAEHPPELQNAFMTYLTRCHHPEREPTREELIACEPYLNAEIRMINPEILVPIGEQTLQSLATEYTTRQPESFAIDQVHATTVRGRGFELIPMKRLQRLDEAARDEFINHVLSNVFTRDYRQTKGRQNR
ncbi:MAG: uracil-DNA glycosylase [Haloquadratum sp. J07HQX50]|nr:MAG: uracil-DNA glycosylase [Haloquadratum sp. J07HQX50]